ncbi:D-alanine--D-alanine ligase [Gimesia maris]|uniref:D-alanine--D-alanine ligase n=1 Tax=Gimesia maris TaxID=122 RepID=A0ABX5YF37_9PLAN|nr:D-alanine--D-alanine ligase [Gimesia maris]EDL57169.1 D-alanine--D-alanine ligase [Gimesia maris DSM 8797]QDU12379.1 D-alanine--D-alanine ligase Ddl [Gimesia maris]QEG14318.1 D-alanine--D-alanine ligase Ddl [Gimesia maris]QGQ32234.1 D-alanine--D-alanine ligase [Gimesia maris]
MTDSNTNPSSTFNIVVLSGGESAESEISLKSGETVARALSSRGHQVKIVDPSLVDLDRFDWTGCDVVFLALHGTYGEDGTIQSTLDRLGIPYSGCDAATSKLAFSKSASKERFIQHNVNTPSYVLIHESDDAGRIEQHARSMGYPLVVKPDAQGSSLGVTIVKSPEELPQALARCFHYDSFGILESAIKGTEWTVTVVDDQVLPLIQIQTPHEFFDYEAKYTEDSTQYLFEFDLPTNVIQAIIKTGVNACTALGTTGIVRVDLLVDRFQQPWVLEVNTIPGFTDHSLVPKAAAKAGIDFGELCEQALTNCLKKVTTRPQN